MASLSQQVSALNARVAKSFYDSFRAKHGRTRFVDNKRFKSEYKVSPDGNIEYRIILPNYVYYTNRGRGAGVGSAEEGFFDSLFSWVRYKIEPDPKKARSITFAIKRKIEKSGTRRNYQKGNAPNTLQAPKQYAKSEILKLLKEEVKRNIKQYAKDENLIIKI